MSGTRWRAADSMSKCRSMSGDHRPSCTRFVLRRRGGDCCRHHPDPRLRRAEPGRAGVLVPRADEPGGMAAWVAWIAVAPGRLRFASMMASNSVRSRSSSAYSRAGELLLLVDPRCRCRRAPPQALICLRVACPLSISILRGLARSETGIRNVNTPAS